MSRSRSHPVAKIGVNPKSECLRSVGEAGNSNLKRITTMNRKFAVVLAIVAIAVTSAVAGMKNPVVGGQQMYPAKNIIENAVNSADHTTLVAAVKAAGLVETLEAPSALHGVFTD